jgi:hypothetical protein
VDTHDYKSVMSLLGHHLAANTAQLKDDEKRGASYTSESKEGGASYGSESKEGCEYKSDFKIIPDGYKLLPRKDSVGRSSRRRRRSSAEIAQVPQEELVLQLNELERLRSSCRHSTAFIEGRILQLKARLAQLTALGAEDKFAAAEKELPAVGEDELLPAPEDDCFAIGIELIETPRSMGFMDRGALPGGHRSLLPAEALAVAKASPHTRSAAACTCCLYLLLVLAACTCCLYFLLVLPACPAVITVAASTCTCTAVITP